MPGPLTIRYYKAPTVLELCCEDDSGITKETEEDEAFVVDFSTDVTSTRRAASTRSTTSLWTNGLMFYGCHCLAGQRQASRSSTSSTQTARPRLRRRSLNPNASAKAVTLMELHQSQGGEVVQEWPRYNKGWRFGCIQAYRNKQDYQEASVNGCSYGLRAPCGGLIKKPWKLRAT